jgi:hypothetical protein
MIELESRRQWEWEGRSMNLSHGVLGVGRLINELVMASVGVGISITELESRRHLGGKVDHLSGVMVSLGWEG